MKRFFKLLSIVLCLCTVLSFAACSNEGPAATTPTIEETVNNTQPEPTEEIVETESTEISTEPNVETEPTATDTVATEPIEETTAPTEAPTETIMDVVFQIVEQDAWAAQEVNVRKGPGTEYERVGTLTLGDAIKLLGIGENGWSKILYNDGEYFAFSDYLTTEMPLAADPNHTHDYKKENVVKPTCTQNGYTLHTCICGKYYTDNKTEKIKHDYEVSQVVEPTCTSKGYTVHKCKNCKATYNDNETDMIAHVYQTKTVKPTCSANGYTLHKCTCGDSYKTDETAKTPHSYENKVISATCETDGYVKYTCKDCDHSYQEANNQKALGHDYSEKGKTVNATCEQDGYTTYKCSRCSKTTNKDKVAALTHDYSVKGNTVEATCESSGYTSYQCSRCNKTTNKNQVDALGHDYSIKGKVVAATCESGGYTTYQCSRCNKTTQKDKIDALGHDYVTETVAPTKDTKGYDIHTCSRCKDSYKDNYTDPVVYYKEVNETVYATQGVNIRKGPGTEYEKIGSLNQGESITRVGIGDNGWSKVKYNDAIAYMFSDYLSTTKPATSDSSGWPKTYSDGSCSITIYKEWYKNAYVYAAHLKFSDYTRFGTDCANGAYKNGYETTSHAAKRLGAIFAVNGCYSSPNLDYTVVRHGKIWNGSGRASFWCPAVYSYHNGKLLSAWDGSWSTPGISGGQIDDLVASGKVTDTFCFGPPSMFNGEIANNTDTSRAQRTFIGTNGSAGDIWVCVSDGRYNDGKSAGLTFKEAAEYLKEKGCTFCVHLDGGGSSTMYFNGSVLNAAKNGQRSVVDFVYFK